MTAVPPPDDSATFAELYDRTAPTAFGLIHAVLPDADEAQRATVEAYRQVWRTGRWPGAGRADAARLVTTVARRCAIARVRASGKRAGISELVKRLCRVDAVATMPVRSHEVLVLTYFCGLTTTETADFLGISKHAVAARLNEALTSLRQRRHWPRNDRETTR